MLQRGEFMKHIAYIYTDFPSKFGIPRQSGLADTQGLIIFNEEYRNPEAFRGLEAFSHIWLLWEFSEAKRDVWQPTVRPPLLGGNKRMGVFATRSPFRPNSIGLSCVELEKIEQTANHGTVLYVRGADLMDATPIYDIKPYLPYTDSRPHAKGGFTEALGDTELDVIVPEDVDFPKEKLSVLTDILRQDPRPHYINDPERVYGFSFGGYEIRFNVREKTLTVISAEKV